MLIKNSNMEPNNKKADKALAIGLIVAIVTLVGCIIQYNVTNNDFFLALIIVNCTTIVLALTSLVFSKLWK